MKGDEGQRLKALERDALDQALCERAVGREHALVHHSDRGAQYVSIRYTERLAEAGIEPSVGRVGDSYDNALAESVIGLYKTEVIRQRGPWRHLEAVEFATLEWVHWFNRRRLLDGKPEAVHRLLGLDLSTTRRNIDACSTVFATELSPKPNCQTPTRPGVWKR